MTATAWMGAFLAVLTSTALGTFAGCSANVDVLAGSTGTGGSTGTSSSSTGTGGSTGTSTSSTSTSTSSSSSSGAGGGGVGACQPGDAPVALATGLVNPAAIALDAEFVYFMQSDSMSCSLQPRVRRVPKVGGAVTVVGSTMNVSSSIAVDGADVYWSDDPVSPCTDPLDQGFAIVSAPTAGGAPVTFPFTAQFQPATDLALDDTHVYWTSADKSLVQRAPKGGGAPEVLAAATAPPAALAVFGGRVYWTSADGVASVAATGGAPTLLFQASPQTTMGGIVVDATGAYFGGSSAPCSNGPPCFVASFVERVALDGSVTTPITPLDVNSQPERVAIDETHVYWTVSQLLPSSEPPVGAVMRADKAGSNATQVANAKMPRGIAVDGACVYWSDVGDGSLWRAPK